MHIIHILISIADPELRTPCVIQLFSQKENQGESIGQINRSQWVFSENDDDGDDDDDDDDDDVNDVDDDSDDSNDKNDNYDDDDDDNDDNDDDDDDDDDNVKSVNNQSDMSGKCCWDVYSSSRYVLKPVIL